ncbi:MAG: translocation/assembly module TamB domain-containing protein, partial [Bacteroidales bacterium]
FDFVMIGLPDFRNTFIDFNFEELRTSVNALQQLANQVNPESGAVPYPWKNLGALNFKGKFTGYPDQFVANGFLATNMGEMIMDLSFRPDTINGTDFEGRLYTRNFQLGAFLEQQEILSSLDMDVLTDGNLRNGQIRASMDGTIDTLDLYGYTYSNILLDGEFSNRTFDGGFTITDPNIKMDFLGKMDFSGEVPEYIFTANVARARPYYLNLVPDEPNSFVSFLIETDLTGRTIDELNGRIRLVNSLFERKNGQLQLYDLDISTGNTADTAWLKLSSEMMDASIEGKYKMTSLPSAFRSLADQYLDLVPGERLPVDSLNHLNYQFSFKHMNPVLDFFFPSVRIGESSELHGTFDPLHHYFSAIGFFPTLQVGGNGWNNVDLFSESGTEQFSFHLQSDSMTIGDNYSLVEHQISMTAAFDTARLEMSWDNRVEPNYSGQIMLNGTFLSDTAEERSFMVEVEPSDFIIDSEPWKVNHSTLLLKRGYLKVDSLALLSTNKHLIADGVISSRTDQDFNLTVKNLKLAELGNLSGIHADLNGNITGNINYQQREGIPYVFSDLRVDTLTFNRQLLGPTHLAAAWNESGNSINIQLLSQLEGARAIEVDGSYTPGSNILDFDVRMNNFELQSLEPYFGDFVQDVEGKSDVQLTVDGTLKEPQLNGEIQLRQGAATVPFLNTRYIVNDNIRLLNNNFYLDDLVTEDAEGHRGVVNGSISNTYFRDFYVNLNMAVDNLQLLNTRSSDNEVFYGTVYASGNATFSGRPSSIRVGLNATTNQNTAIYLPLYNAREVASTDFITFVEDTEEKELRSIQRGTEKIQGVEMEMDVNITPDAVVQLIFDPQVGDIIETSGEGRLRMTLNPTSGFRILGDVELVRGDYLFTLQNVINKRFQISPGGKIYFNGDPTDATVDLDAIYTTRTAPYNLYPGDPNEASESLKRRIPVECHLDLQGDLRSPTITTSIEMPTADPETRNLLENSTSTEEETMRQFLSLLVINNFYSVSGYGGQNMGAMNTYIAGVTASELLSNQLSNWLSQISDDFDIGVNYRPGDEISSDEVEVALSTQLLDDRIIISGNVDVGGQQANPSTTASNNPYIMGDFDVEFRVTDNVSVIAFNRARDELLFETAPYKQGVGISYREEFNNLGHLLQRYKEGLTNRKKRKRNSPDPDPVE